MPENMHEKRTPSCPQCNAPAVFEQPGNYRCRSCAQDYTIEANRSVRINTKTTFDWFAAVFDSIPIPLFAVMLYLVTTRWREFGVQGLAVFWFLHPVLFSLKDMAQKEHDTLIFLYIRFFSRDYLNRNQKVAFFASLSTIIASLFLVVFPLV